jgi:hypothetical protein
MHELGLLGGSLSEVSKGPPQGYCSVAVWAINDTAFSNHGCGNLGDLFIGFSKTSWRYE